MIFGPFYTYLRIHFTSENASFCDICLSHIIPSLRTRKPSKVHILLLIRINGQVILTSKGQRSRSLKTKMSKSSSLAYFFVKSGSIYVKPRPKWFYVHSTHIVECISPAKMRNFYDTIQSASLPVCHVPFVFSFTFRLSGRPHITSAIWPCTFLFVLVSSIYLWLRMLTTT